MHSSWHNTARQTRTRPLPLLSPWANSVAPLLFKFTAPCGHWRGRHRLGSPPRRRPSKGRSPATQLSRSKSGSLTPPPVSSPFPDPRSFFKFSLSSIRSSNVLCCDRRRLSLSVESLLFALPSSVRFLPLPYLKTRLLL